MDWPRQQTFKWWDIGWRSSKDSVWYKIRCCFYSSDCVCTAVRWGWCHSSQLYSWVSSQRSTQSKGTTSNTLINSYLLSAVCLSICTLWFNARYDTVTVKWNILNNWAKFQTILKMNFIKHIKFGYGPCQSVKCWDGYTVYACSSAIHRQ